VAFWGGEWRFCRLGEIQTDGWGVTNGMSDALANAAGRGQDGASSDSISVIALAFGYESESAFSTAFISFTSLVCCGKLLSMNERLRVVHESSSVN
jgi:AraC-like DNA-binding protein